MSLFLVVIGALLFYAFVEKRPVTGLSDVPEGRFKRGDLISKVSKGDKNAAFELGQHYARVDLPEAAYYWFGIAFKLGNTNVDQFFLDHYEHTIIGQYDAGPYNKAPA